MRDGRFEIRTELDCLRSELKGATMVYDAIAGADPREDRELVAQKTVEDIRARLVWEHERRERIAS